MPYYGYDKDQRKRQNADSSAVPAPAAPSAGSAYAPKATNYRAVRNDAAVPSTDAPRPTYLGTYDQQLADLYGAITTRPAFSYDVAQDPLYQQYKDQYIQGGKLAMKDTMGQAAALTGGYGSTYGQQVGQQAYDAYLQKLGEVVPELYNSAYSKYADEGDRMMQQYSMLAAMQQDEYQRYQDDYDRWWQQQQWDASRADVDYDRQQQSYSQLYAIIGATGYQPTDEELGAAGMTREAAEALRQEYLRATGQLEPTGGGGGGGGGGAGGLADTETSGGDTDYTKEEVLAYIYDGIVHGYISGWDDPSIQGYIKDYGIKKPGETYTPIGQKPAKKPIRTVQ